MKKIAAALAAVALLLGGGPAFAQVTQNNLNLTNQSTSATSSATATGGTGIGVGIGTGGDASSNQSQSSSNTNKNKNENDNALVNNPSQSITSNSVPNLIQLPGFVPGYPNFTQPYKPDAFINGAGPVRPTSMTYAQAKACNGQATEEKESRSIKLYYPQWDKVAPSASMSGYVGSVRVEDKDGFWIEAVCEGARKAMDKGATEGVVEYIIRPVNRTWGFGGSASFGGSGMPAGGANPYALAGAVGLGMGISGAYVKGELMLTVTGFTGGSVKSARLEDAVKPVSFEPGLPEQAQPQRAQPQRAAQAVQAVQGN